MADNPSVRDLTHDMDIAPYLKDKLAKLGFDGLCNSELDCGCTFDDFMPCDGCDYNECVGGYIHRTDAGEYVGVFTEEQGAGNANRD